MRMNKNYLAVTLVTSIVFSPISGVFAVEYNEADSTFEFNIGDGEVVLDDTESQVSHLAFGEGITPFLAPNYAKLEGPDGTDLVFEVTADDKLVVQNWLNTNGIPKLQTFSYDGESYNMANYVSQREPDTNLPRITFRGYSQTGITTIDYSNTEVAAHYSIDVGVDSVKGGANDDSYSYYSAHRNTHTTLDDSSGDDYIILWWTTPETVDFDVVGGDLQMTFASGSTLTILDWIQNDTSKIEKFMFANIFGRGEVWTSEDILANIAPELLP